MEKDFDLNEAFQAALITENYEKRYGSPPDWSLKNAVFFWVYWHFFGGKRYNQNLHIYALGVDDYVESYKKIRDRGEEDNG